MSNPTVFMKYPDLPVELQRQIVQEAASSLLEERANTHYFQPSLGHFACVDSIWRDVIERRTFRYLHIMPRDLEDFGIICGKRHGILHYIELRLRQEPNLDAPIQLLVNDTVDTHATMWQALETLMGIMKDWDPEERQRPGLIKLGLDLCDYGAPLGPAIHHDFSYLPQVRIIGDMHQIWPGFLHPSSMISLYEKLPNVNRVSLRLPLVPEVPSSFQDATDAIHSLRALPCRPKKLRLSRYGSYNEEWLGVQAELQVVQCLTTPGPRWSDTITTLDVSCINNVATFFGNSQEAFWPQLKTLKLGGMFDSAPVGSRKETGSSVVQGLIGCLPKMPKILTVKIDIKPYDGYVGMAINLYLGTSPVAECLTTAEKVPFLPDAKNGIARFSRVSIPGHLASELQDIIWRYHGLLVSVFYLSGDFYDEYHGLTDGGDPDNFYDGWDWGSLPNHFWHYQQWNREKDAWECFGFSYNPGLSLELYPVLPEESNDSEATAV